MCIHVDQPSHISNELSRVAKIEEMNLLYVAVTRAKKSVILTPTLVNILKGAKEYFVYPTVENSQLVSVYVHMKVATFSCLCTSVHYLIV